MKEGKLAVPEGRSHIHGVRMIEIGSEFEVFCSPGIRSYRIIGAGNERVLGTLHGVILSAERDGIAVEGGDIRVTAAIPDTSAFETAVLDRIRGTFVVETHTSLPRRLYPDTGGTLPLVFCARTRRAGSSAGMLLDPEEYRARLLTDRVERLIRREGMGSWIPGSLTAHEGVERLLSNHFLDLETWRAVRFWPRRETFAQDMEIEEAATIIAHEIPAFLRDAAAEFRVGITLTAGFDSRLLLAAARDVLGQVEFFTTTPETRGLDQILPEKMSRALGFRYRLAPLLAASEREMVLWDHAVGHAVLESNRSAGATLRGLDYDVILTGLFGEPGRSRLYRHDYETINGKPVTPKLILSRLGRPQDPELMAEVSRWMQDLNGLPTSAILDLAHMELKGSSWAMAQHAAQCAVQLEMNPFAQRSIRQAFLSVPPERKGTEALFLRAIAMMWPEVMEYPVNRFGDYRDVLAKVPKVFNPRSVWVYLRSRLS